MYFMLVRAVTERKNVLQKGQRMKERSRKNADRNGRIRKLL